MSEPFVIQPIGVVHSPFRTTKEIPVQGGRSTLEISPEYAEGLDGLENSSHLIVVAQLHLADRSVLKARSKIAPSSEARGVFATRSPVRPNPLSISVVPLLARDGSRLEVDYLDLLDGTPLVDLKAYCPTWDSVFSAQHAHRTEPSSVDDARMAACLERELRSFMGASASEAAPRWGMAATFVGARALGIDPRDPRLMIAVNRIDATTEALLALTAAAFSNGRLQVKADGAGPLRVGFGCGGKSVELIACLPEVPENPACWAEAFRIERTS